MLKKMLVAVTFVTVIATPTFAQPYLGLDELKLHPSTTSDARHSVRRTYAQGSDSMRSRSDIVVSEGRVARHDPDSPNRLELLHEGNYAGSCIDQITKIEHITQWPTLIPLAKQSIDAQLHRQPTPQTVKSAAETARGEVVALLGRAKELDATGDAARCKSVVSELKRRLRV